MQNLTPDTAKIFNRSLLRQRRNRAQQQGAALFLLRQTETLLLERLSLIKRSFKRILLLGAYDAVFLQQLQTLPNTELVIASELTPELAISGAQYGATIATDEEALPFAPASFDLVISLLALQWVNDLPGCLWQIKQVLKPDGLFLGAIMGGESLFELRHSLAEAEIALTGGMAPRLSPMLDLQTGAALLQRAQFALPVVDTENIMVHYKSLPRLLHDLRAMAATNATYQRAHTLGRAVLAETDNLYRQKFATQDGLLPATFNLHWWLGWAPDATQPKAIKRGSAQHSLADALNSTQHSAGEKTPP